MKLTLGRKGLSERKSKWKFFFSIFEGLMRGKKERQKSGFSCHFSAAKMGNTDTRGFEEERRRS